MDNGGGQQTFRHPHLSSSWHPGVPSREKGEGKCIFLWYRHIAVQRAVRGFHARLLSQVSSPSGAVFNLADIFTHLFPSQVLPGAVVSDHTPLISLLNTSLWLT